MSELFPQRFHPPLRLAYSASSGWRRSRKAFDAAKAEEEASFSPVNSRGKAAAPPPLAAAAAPGEVVKVVLRKESVLLTSLDDDGGGDDHCLDLADSVDDRVLVNVLRDIDSGVGETLVPPEAPPPPPPPGSPRPHDRPPPRPPLKSLELQQKNSDLFEVKPGANADDFSPQFDLY